MTMSLYPIFLKLDQHKVLIVGGGAVAEQKIEGVLRSARDVTVIAPQVTEAIARWSGEGRVNHVKDEYRPGMAQGYFLVIAATDSESVNRALSTIRTIAASLLPPSSTAVTFRSRFPLAAPARPSPSVSARNWRCSMAPNTVPGRHGWDARAPRCGRLCREAKRASS
jgi:hypothetical protein